MKRLIFILLLLFPAMSFADECAMFDTTPWNNDQRNHLHPFGYEVFVTETAEDITPIVTNIELDYTICFPGAVANVQDVVTLAALQQVYQDWVDTNAAEAAAHAAQQQAWGDEVALQICGAPMELIDEKIDAIVDPVSNLSNAKDAMKVLFKKVARCLRARTGLLGQEQ